MRFRTHLRMRDACAHDKSHYHIQVVPIACGCTQYIMLPGVTSNAVSSQNWLATFTLIFLPSKWISRRIGIHQLSLNGLFVNCLLCKRARHISDVQRCFHTLPAHALRPFRWNSGNARWQHPRTPKCQGPFSLLCAACSSQWCTKPEAS